MVDGVPRELASIGYNGQPVRPPLRPVRPPVPVLIDLAALFPRPPHRVGRYHPHGLQLHRIVAGRLNKQIADDLGISIKTVEAHRANIMEKLNANTVADLLKTALSAQPKA